MGKDRGVAAAGIAEGADEPGWVTFDVTDAVRAIVAGAENHGWLLIAPESGASGRFVSSDSVTDPSLRPTLEVVTSYGWQGVPRRGAEGAIRGVRTPAPAGRPGR